MTVGGSTTRLSELQMRVAHHAVAVEAGESAGGTSTATWWAHATHQAVPEARRVTRFAAKLEAHEAKLLDDEETKAAKASSFSMRRDGHGTARGSVTLPELHADMLEKALRALAALKHVRSTEGAGSYEHAQPTRHRMGQAFEEYIENYPTTATPEAGGTAATVVITMSLETLLGGLGAASLDTGERISAGTARRLACQAGLVPMVLDTASVVLDQGRKTRLHTTAQRLALTVQQKHCQAGHCDIPAAMCHVHHTTPWSKGGATDLANAQLLCPKHHRMIHRDPPDPRERT